jgi:hypothetical protein
VVRSLEANGPQLYLRFILPSVKRHSKYSRAQREETEREIAIRALAAEPEARWRREREETRLPASPFEAYYVRRFASLRDALKAYRADKPMETLPSHMRGKTTSTVLAETSTEDLVKELEEDLRSRPHLIGLMSRMEGELRSGETPDPEFVRSVVDEVEKRRSRWVSGAFHQASLVCEWEKLPLRRAAVDQINDALGPDGLNYEAALRFIDSNSDSHLTHKDRTERELKALLRYPDPVRSLAAELEFHVRSLVWAYASPDKFFLEIAPKRYRYDFDLRVLGPNSNTVARAVCLGTALWRWGFGALKNLAVADAFWSLMSEGGLALQVLALAEGRRVFSEGRPPGTGVSPSDALEALEQARLYVADLDPLARAEDLTIFPEPQEPARRRSPSREAAARIRAANDLQISRGTLRRKVKSAQPKKFE